MQQLNQGLDQVNSLQCPMNVAGYPAMTDLQPALEGKTSILRNPLQFGGYNPILFSASR